MLLAVALTLPLGWLPQGWAITACGWLFAFMLTRGICLGVLALRLQRRAPGLP